MEEKLISLQKERKKREYIIALCSLLNICICIFVVANLFFNFVSSVYYYIGVIILLLTSNHIIKRQRSKALRQKKALAEEIKVKIERLQTLLESLTAKHNEFLKLDTSQPNSEEELQKKFLSYAEYVFVDVLNKMVEITGVAPDPIMLSINTKEDVEQLFSLALAMIATTIALLSGLETQLQD